MPIESGLLEILACPACHAPLQEQGPATDQPSAAEAESELLCTGEKCGLAYPIRDGIPVLLVDEARRPA